MVRPDHPSQAAGRESALRPASPLLADRARRALFSARSRRLWGVTGLVLTVIILGLALTPTTRGPSLGWDKANHAAAFAALAFCGHFAWRERAGHVARLVLALLLLGIGIEIAQRAVPGRSAEAADLLADAVGIGIGLLIAGALSRALERRRVPRPPRAE